MLKTWWYIKKPLGFKGLKVRRSFCAELKNTQLLMFRVSYVKTNYGIKQRPKKKVTMVKSSFFDRKPKSRKTALDTWQTWQLTRNYAFEGEVL